MKTLIHPENVDKEIVLIGGKVDTIIKVLTSKEYFRIKSEENTKIVKDYTYDDLIQADHLKVSFDKGKTWKEITLHVSAF